MVQRTNKTIETITGIDAMIMEHVPQLSMEDDEDRASMAWWIYKTFCKGDYRKEVQTTNIKKNNRVLGIE